MEEVASTAAAWDVKAVLTLASLIVSPIAAFVALVLGIANWMRTGRVNKQTLSNNRAARFEAVHGTTLSSAINDLRTMVRSIRSKRPTLTSVGDAIAFCKGDLKPKITETENVFVSELKVLKTSELTQAPDLWAEATKGASWEVIWSVYGEILAATAIDKIPDAFDRLEAAVDAILTAAVKAREVENNIAQ